MQKKLLISAESLSKSVVHYTIGFAHLKDQDAISAGSGTLVTIGSLHGVLTAAHVVAGLPKHGEVGIILNAEPPAQHRRMVLNMDHIEEPVVIRDEEFGPTGPDLAFLRLPDEAVAALKATNSFYNLDKRRNEVLGRQVPTKSHTDMITGTIHELTVDAPAQQPRVRRIDFHTIFCGVRPSAVRYLKTHDLLYVQLATEHEPAFKIPDSFEGTSGGAVWRLYVAENDGKLEVVERRLMAVPFHQGFATDGRREIACHGPNGIYGALIDRVRQRWPTLG